MSDPVRVLFVDDEPQMLRAIERLMRGHGFEVHLATGAEEALRVLEERAISILVSDFGMPGIGGRALIKHARERHPELLCVLMSGTMDEEVKGAVLSSGEIDAFIGKPWPPGALQNLLTELQATLETRR